MNFRKTIMRNISKNTQDGNLSVFMRTKAFLARPWHIGKNSIGYAECICNIVRIISFAGIYFRLLLHLVGYWF